MPTRCRPLLGTFVEITVAPEAASAIDAAFGAIARVQALMSFHAADSDLARIRVAQPGECIEIAPETCEVLRIASELHRASNGLFDVTVGRELVRGGFLPRPARGPFRGPFGWPFRGERGATMADIELLEGNRVRCTRPVLIDLGGIAKGYAVDQAIAALRAAGACEGLVNAGGDMRLFGPRRWPVGLRDADGRVRTTIELADCAIASSANLGNRHRRWGRRVTPHIGFGRKPILCKERVSVIAPRCVIADAMTKIAMADRALAGRLLAPHGGQVLAD
ncbi:FAD:protein FMN transferase [Novosphingobium sp. 1949]|uniref:FAD:protein FMN transferase n=1 Tax=Novosphingobium organovorum TaxID=2930092 RepID=A0ABT0B973_9SPHN|nr:FAD:protein FMN transferase [Novosphingobium organovorum]MCJ2181592.1 FAD:protein FMN transferase [Novosphingobium organovorum]